MKKHLILVVAAIFSAAMFISCGSSGTKTNAVAHITVSEDDTEYLTEVINIEHLGEKGIDFIQIVPGTYAVASEESALLTTIPLQIVEGKKYPQYKPYTFSLFVTDAEENYIKANGEKVEFTAIEKDAAYKNLCNASIGEIVNVTFSYTPASPEELQQITAAITSCEIELSVEKPDEY